MVIAIIIFLTLAVLLISGYNYLSGKALIRDYFLYRKLKSTSLESLDRKWADGTNKSDVIISFTTIPERIENIEWALKSLLYQKLLPKRIHIYLPYRSFRNNKEYVIPAWVQNLQSVNIVRIETDYGPATKFIPAILSLEENQKVMVTDDDNIYPPNYIEELSRAADQIDSKVVAASGWRVPEDLVDRPTTLMSNILKKAPTPVPSTRIKSPYPIDILQGYSAFILRPKFFDKEAIVNYEGVPKNIRFVDDVWVSAHCLVEKVVVPMRRFCFTPFFMNDFFKSSSLAKINNWNREKPEDRNNSIAIRFFEDKWK